MKRGVFTMQTILLDAAEDGAIAWAASLLAEGKIVGLPTETVYGLAADASRPEALAAIFEAKERPLFDPLIVHLPGVEWLDRITQPTESERDLVQQLTAAFWPGPLTLLLPRRVAAVPDLVTAGSSLVAVRMSAHPVFAGVLQAFGSPVAAPSANRFGRISPTTGTHVLRELDGRIPLILDAGPSAHGLESTIIAFESSGDALRILRPGPITAEMLGEFASVSRASAETESARSAPGQLAGHYAPRTPLRILRAGQEPCSLKLGKRLGLLAYRSEALVSVDRYEKVEILSADGDSREAAARLFAALRRLDEAGLDVIVAEEVPETGLGVAIMERLRRAATGSGGDHTERCPEDRAIAVKR